MSFHYTGRERPICPGASVGITDGEPGTITALVRKTTSKDKAVYALSCEHVLKPKNAGNSISVVQPAIQDGIGTGSYNRIGKSVITANLSLVNSNVVDAAIVKLNGNVKGQNFLRSENLYMRGVDTDVHVGQKVLMIGRSSGTEVGQITEMNASEIVNYQRLGWSASMNFVGVLKANYKNAPGDSGAPVINPTTGDLIGIHFSGKKVSEGKSESFICPIQSVFEKLKIELI